MRYKNLVKLRIFLELRKKLMDSKVEWNLKVEKTIHFYARYPTAHCDIARRAWNSTNGIKFRIIKQVQNKKKVTNMNSKSCHLPDSRLEHSENQDSELRVHIGHKTERTEGFIGKTNRTNVRE